MAKPEENQGLARVTLYSGERSLERRLCFHVAVRARRRDAGLEARLPLRREFPSVLPNPLPDRRSSFQRRVFAAECEIDGVALGRTCAIPDAAPRGGSVKSQ